MIDGIKASWYYTYSVRSYMLQEQLYIDPSRQIAVYRSSTAGSEHERIPGAKSGQRIPMLFGSNERPLNSTDTTFIQWVQKRNRQPQCHWCRILAEHRLPQRQSCHWHSRALQRECLFHLPNALLQLNDNNTGRKKEPLHRISVVNCYLWTTNKSIWANRDSIFAIYAVESTTRQYTCMFLKRVLEIDRKRSIGMLEGDPSSRSLI